MGARPGMTRASITVELLAVGLCSVMPVACRAASPPNETGYYSPLSQINAGNVQDLGFAWEFKTGTYRGMEATPVVADGVLYTSGPWGAVYALDAASGALKWRFDPHSDGQVARSSNVDVANRGVALARGK